jgi:hypothetical protein
VIVIASSVEALFSGFPMRGIAELGALRSSYCWSRRVLVFLIHQFVLNMRPPVLASFNCLRMREKGLTMCYRSIGGLRCYLSAPTPSPAFSSRVFRCSIAIPFLISWGPGVSLIISVSLCRQWPSEGYFHILSKHAKRRRLCLRNLLEDSAIIYSTKIVWSLVL